MYVKWGWSFSRCPRGQGVGGKPNVHTCPLGVGGWFTKGKNMSTWLLNAPSAQGCSLAFDIGGAQASKIILSPFSLKYSGAQTLLLL